MIDLASVFRPNLASLVFLCVPQVKDKLVDTLGLIKASPTETFAYIQCCSQTNPIAADAGLKERKITFF